MIPVSDPTLHATFLFKVFDLTGPYILSRVPIQAGVGRDFAPNYAFSMRVRALRRQSLLSDLSGLEPGGNLAC